MCATFFAAMLMTLSGFALAPAMAQTPNLSYALPAALRPGQSTDLTLYGEQLAGATGIWFSFPCTATLAPGIEGNGTKADQVTYRVSVPSDVAVGIGGVRVATGQGASNLRLVMIDDLPSTTDNGQNKSRETAQSIPAAVAVDGACEAEGSDFYKLAVSAGQRLSVEAMARRLGSPMDPVVRLLDSAGKELVYADDDPALGADCRFAFTFSASGEYTIEIRDVRYQGGPNYRYRLRVGDFPLPATPFPLAVTKGKSASLELTGAAVQGAFPMNVSMPADFAASRLNVAACYPQGQGSSGVSVIASETAEHTEQEPNDTPETATTCSLPCGLNGRFEKPRDVDYFQFEAKQGQRFVFAAQSRSLGSASALLMRLYKADGAMVAEAEDSGAEEPRLDYAFGADGTYRLRVEELTGRGGADHSYRIAAEPYHPGFALAVVAERFNAPQGGVFVAKVTSTRRDYNGPIHLVLQGVEGVSLAGNDIPEGKNETTFTATLPASLAPGQLLAVNVVGQAKIGDSEVRAKANNRADLRTLLGGLPYPPEAVDGVIGLGVGPVFPDFFQLAAEPKLTALPSSGGTFTLKIGANRTNGFEDAIDVKVEGLPADVVYKAQPVAKGQKEAVIEIAASPMVAAGHYPLRLIGNATFKNQPRQSVVDQVAFDVARAVRLGLQPAGPLAPGGTQKVLMTLSGEVAAAEQRILKLTWSNLPPGVTGPEQVTLAAGQDKAEAELKAAADAKPVTADNISVAALLSSGGRDASIASSPFTLEVKSP